MGKKKDKKEKKAGKRMTKKELVKNLLDFFHQKQGETLPLKYIFDQLHLTTHPLKMLCMDVLRELQDDDYINEIEKHKYKLNTHGVEMTGIFQRKSNGKNSFLPDGGGDPIFIAERNSAHAMAGDRVKIAFYAKRRGRSAEGEVIEILERAKDTFVGTLEVSKSYAFLVTENRTLANDIFIPRDKLKGGKSGDKAVVKVFEWPDKAKNPIGQVIDILGRAGDNTTEMHAILAEYGLPYTYPTAVEKAAERIPDEIPAEEIARREDFRTVTTFTIDPKDAKDFDDALSIRRLKDGLWEVGVHIADVTHYVKEGNIIDKEAEKRATSVYLVDRTIPMLPERLCNYICSLRPDEEKLAYSVIFQLNDKAEVKDARVVHTVIRSNRRFTYNACSNAGRCGCSRIANGSISTGRFGRKSKALQVAVVGTCHTGQSLGNLHSNFRHRRCFRQVKGLRRLYLSVDRDRQRPIRDSLERGKICINLTASNPSRCIFIDAATNHQSTNRLLLVRAANKVLLRENGLLRRGTEHIGHGLSRREQHGRLRGRNQGALSQKHAVGFKIARATRDHARRHLNNVRSANRHFFVSSVIAWAET